MKLTEKDKKIVAAVFASCGEPQGGIGHFDCIGVSLGMGAFYRAGEVHYIATCAMTEFWEVICTIEEFNKCIEDMSRAEWMFQEGSFYSYDAYKISCALREMDTSNKTLLKENCDYSFYDKSLVYTQEMKDSGTLPLQGMKVAVKGEWLFVGLNKLGSWVLERENSDEMKAFPGDRVKPIKTLEQIKQDKVKEQIMELTSKYRNHKGCIQGLFMTMQKDGYIVEPK